MSMDSVTNCDLQPRAESSNLLTVFLKLGPKCKKAEWTVSPEATLKTLKELVRNKFPDYKAIKLPPLYISHRTTQQQYELTDVTDIYQYAVIEIKDPRFDTDENGVHRTRFDMYGQLVQREKLVLVMVGLPARGKTYISSRVARYLNWIGVETRVFNVGSYRRARLGAHQTADFFDPNNAEGNRARLHMAVAALDDMINWLHTSGRVGIYDATNSTEERRRLVLRRCQQEKFQVMFIESICEDPLIISNNIKDTKTSMPDYAGVDPETAMRDFQNRIEQYKKSYQTINDDSLSYVKLIDVGRTLIVNNVNAYLPNRIVFFLMHLHITPRPIWLTRHGESMANVANQIGGDSDLSPLGQRYAQALAEWVAEQFGQRDESSLASPSATSEAEYSFPLTVWTSTLKRAIQTAQYIPVPKLHLRCLDEIDAGALDGMTYEEIAAKMPEEFASRAADKLRYRYPQGESYEDVVQRIEPVLLELERQKSPVLIVAHQAILRTLYGYFMEKDMEQLPLLDIPLHTVIQITPRAYGCKEEWFSLVHKMKTVSKSALG